MIKKLSLGSHLDLVDELQYEEDDVYIMSSSSCSISISSSGAEHESSHQITVPVYVEPAPPEIRLPSSDPTMDDSHLSAGGGGVFGGGMDVEAATGDIVGLLQGDRRPRFAHQVQQQKYVKHYFHIKAFKDLLCISKILYTHI